MAAPNLNSPIQPSSASQFSQSEMKSYASATSTEYFPKDNQALIIDSIDGSTLDDYVSQIMKLINREHIKAISRISNNRICVYFATKKIADDLVDLKKTIVIQGKILSFRPLISRAKRIILSNVRPSIPHEEIEKALIDLHIRAESRLTFIRAGVSLPGCSHMVSFRRQIYVKPEDTEKIPESFIIDYEGSKFRIFASTDSMTCFICKEIGHLAKQCPLNDNNTQLIIEESTQRNEHSPKPTLPGNSAQNQKETKNELIHNSNIKLSTLNYNTSSTLFSQQSTTYNNYSQQDQLSHSPMPPPGSKRAPPSTLSSCSSILPDKEKANLTKSTIKNNKKSTKKIKTSNENDNIKTDLETQIEYIKENLTSKTEFSPLSTEQVTEFLQASYRNQNIRELALNYTDDMSALTTTLNVIQEKSTDKNLKSRILRIIKKLKNFNQDSPSSDESATTDESSTLN